MKCIVGIVIVASLAILVGCSDSKVVLQAGEGGKKLVYDPNNFHPQVETMEDVSLWAPPPRR